jgi:hypothetical protein
VLGLQACTAMSGSFNSLNMVSFSLLNMLDVTLMSSTPGSPQKQFLLISSTMWIS